MDAKDTMNSRRKFITAVAAGLAGGLVAPAFAQQEAGQAADAQKPPQAVL